MSAANEIKRGKEALVYFHNASLAYPAYQGRTIEQLFSDLSQANPAFLEGFGFGLEQSEVSEDRVQAAMEELAATAQGRVPKWNAYFSAVQGKTGQVSYLDAIKFVSAETVKELGAGLQVAGDATIAGLKNASGLVAYLPYIALAAGAFYLYTVAGGLGRKHAG